MPTSLDRLRTVLDERYAIERELGQGGTATVYLAQDLKYGAVNAPSTDRVGLKVSHSHPMVPQKHPSLRAVHSTSLVRPLRPGAPPLAPALH